MKKNALAVVEGFRIAKPYENMTPEELEELKDQMSDLDEESGIRCRMIKVPTGGKLAYEIQGEDDGDETYEKELDAVLIFTHRMNAYWPNGFGGGALKDKIPACSSMDSKTGVNSHTREVVDCDSCPYNQFGSGGGGAGKACKNMRRMYLMRNGDPNFYLLTIPPTSIRDVNKMLNRLLKSGTLYTSVLLTFRLARNVNAAGIEYSVVKIEKKGLLPPDAAAAALEMRKVIHAQFQSVAVTDADYNTAPPRSGRGVDVNADDFNDDDSPPPLTDDDLPPWVVKQG